MLQILKEVMQASLQCENYPAVFLLVVHIQPPSRYFFTDNSFLFLLALMVFPVHISEL